MQRWFKYSKVVATVAVTVFAATVFAQPHSLSDRVALLEARSSDPQASVELLNQVNALQAQVREQQGKLEQLEHSNAQFEQLNARIAALDQRMMRFESQQQSFVPTQHDKVLSQTPLVPNGTSLAASPAASVASPQEMRDYQHAFGLLKKGQYADASDAFLAFLSRYPAAHYTPNAMYWLGESYYATRNYQLAKKQFETLLRRYPTHLKSSGGLLKLALTERQLGDTQAARAHLKQLISAYPASQAAHFAQEQLQTLDHQASAHP